MRCGKSPASPGSAAAIESGFTRAGPGLAARHWLAGSLVVVTALIVAALLDDSAGAQTSVAPVLRCSGSMALDSASGQCRTPRTETAQRPSGCPAGSTRVPGQYGGHVCQTKVTKKVATGRTQQVYSHSTYATAWIATGTQRVKTGTKRVWVPPRTTFEPLVPPVRVQVGTRTESKTVTRPGPQVLYEVSYEVEVETERVVKRCAFGPIAGRQCWDQTVTETRTQTRTRLECCIPGPPVTTTVTTTVPVYEYRTTHSVTIPGYWGETPVYESRETGYWDRVETRHYTQAPVYETVVEWVTSPVTKGPCPSGWQPAGDRCSRTVLGEPSSAPTQGCPPGSVPVYGDAPGGTGPSALTCRSSRPASNPDTGTDAEDSGGPDDGADGGNRPLHHLAGESDERLAELGIHRCANGLLSYVPCDRLPGRSWDSDPDVCDDIEGTIYRSDHGGSCVTQSDLLNKCTTPGDCRESTVRTYCPAIGELATTQIQEHAHPRRGAETYRVCVFDCSSFGTLPSYVQTRINGSYDYACLPGGDAGESDDEDTDEDEDRDEEEDEGGEDDKEDDPETDQEDEEEEETEDDGDDDDGDEVDEIPLTPTAIPEDKECPSVPSTTAAADMLSGLRWASHVRSAGAGRSPQRSFPGGGQYLQVAPGRGWAEVRGSVEVSEHGCRWIATRVRVSWADQRPWVAAERRAMESGDGTRHLVRRWDALDSDQQLLVRQWHRPGAVPAEVVCSVEDAAGSAARSSCGWVLAYPAAYAWRASFCFELESSSGRPSPERRAGSEPAAEDPCWVPVASGVDWIRSIGDYADGRVTVTRSGAGS